MGMLSHPRLGLLTVAISQCCNSELWIHLMWTFVASWGQLVQDPFSPESEAVDWAGSKASRPHVMAYLGI